MQDEAAVTCFLVLRGEFKSMYGRSNPPPPVVIQTLQCSLELCRLFTLQPRNPRTPRERHGSRFQFPPTYVHTSSQRQNLRAILEEINFASSDPPDSSPPTPPKFPEDSSAYLLSQTSTLHKKAHLSTVSHRARVWGVKGEGECVRVGDNRPFSTPLSVRLAHSWHTAGPPTKLSPLLSPPFCNPPSFFHEHPSNTPHRMSDMQAKGIPEKRAALCPGGTYQTRHFTSPRESNPKPGKHMGMCDSWWLSYVCCTTLRSCVTPS
ncbi:unnamed protein product [Pleuronectes platessa]|uniref:Uncharacterized protein n=1 Tax=Pleuronectes platessa TaxID=8262 RepID=A0A9N7UNN1_PLEPL|nr:unnamed protein product [Pleuronectes platessa]